METQLSAIKAIAVGALDFAKERILSDDYSDEEIVKILQMFSLNINKDYINKNDYVNADQAIKILGKGFNRTKFFEVTKKYGIINHTMNNQHIGFLRKEIENLACQLKKI